MKPAIGYTPVPVEGGGMARWDGNPARRPKAGELYLSGAVPMAYPAANAVRGIFFIAQRIGK